MIRILLVLILVLIDFIISLPMFIIGYIVGLFSKRAKDVMWQVIVKIYLKVIGWMAGAKVNYIGLENIPKDTAVLYVGNHSSYFDIVLSYPVLPGVAGFIAKKELLKVPVLAQIMIQVRCLFLDRDNIKEGLKLILKAVEDIKSGVSLFIFPEGTRSKDGNIAEFKEGSLKIATKAGCPIIPVAFSNTSAIFEDHFPFIKVAKVTIEFGKPIYVNELDKEEQKHIGKKVHDLIVDMKNQEA